MNLRIVVPVVGALVLASALPAAACDGHSKNSASSASAYAGSCSAHSSAWAGAFLQRTQNGLTVLAVAEGSPAARSGLRAGDVVLAVNGHEMSAAKSGHMCSDGTACAVGSSFAYTVQRGKATKTVKVKLEKMPVEATTRYASREASYDPALAAMVIPIVD